jgi:hypothetical protein
MNKLQLNLDDLSVDSFHATDEPGGDAGTVRGQNDPIDANSINIDCPASIDDITCVNCSVDATCGDLTCAASCEITCVQTCDFSCNGTCDIIACGSWAFLCG